MFPRMYSSVKFLDPTVTETLPFAAFDWMRLSEDGSPAVVELELDVSLLEPQAATPSANEVAMAATRKRRGRTNVIRNTPLSNSSRDTRGPIILCASGRALQLEPLRGQQVLDADQHQLERQCQERHEDSTGQHAVVAEDISAQ